MVVSPCRPTVAIVDVGAVVRNLRRLRDLIGTLDVWPVVKADAYGHGAVPVARALARERVAGFCVATASEGRQLREAGIVQPILVMAPPGEGGGQDPGRLCAEYGLSCAVQDAAEVAALSAASRALGVGPTPVHVKVDTGMGRLGVPPAEAVTLARAVAADPGVSLEGIFSNLASGDSVLEEDPGYAFAREQIALFREVVGALREECLLPAHRTLANSAALMHHPGSWQGEAFTGVRPGLALYGASLTPGLDPVELTPAMRLVTRIGAVRSLPQGVPVGYGLAFTTWRPTRVGVLPVGYHDGLPRALSDRGWVSVRGRRVPIIGRISMDLTLVDITDVSAARAGDEVVLFGAGEDAAPDQHARESGYAATLSAALAAVDEVEQPGPLGRFAPGRGPILVEEVADWADTIPHEILCRIGARVPRHYIGEQQR